MSRLPFLPPCSRLLVPSFRVNGGLLSRPILLSEHCRLAGSLRSFSRRPPIRPSNRVEKIKLEPQTATLPTSEEVLASEEPDLRTPKSSRNAVLFTVMGSLGVYLWAATSTNANTDARVTKIIRERGGGEVGAIDNRVLLLERAYEVKESLERGLYRLRQTTQGLPTIPQTAILEAYAYVATKWIQAPDPLKVCWAICALNTSVFIAWRIPALAPFMLRNFLHRPLSGRVHTLLTSVFSHQSFMHLFFNCYALHGFGSATGYYLAQQQNEAPSKLLESTNAFHFIAFFISAGIFASFASHALRLRAYDLIKRNLVATALRRAKGSVGGSLGASGAIYSCVAVAALAFPQLHVNVLFIPIDIPIQTAVGSLVLMDIVGLVRGWSTFDHIAHLGGALFGLVYYMYGPKIWDRCRVTCARWFGGKRKLVVY